MGKTIAAVFLNIRMSRKAGHSFLPGQRLGLMGQALFLLFCPANSGFFPCILA